MPWNKTGKFKEAEAIFREALGLRTQLLPKEHFWIGLAKGALGECLTTQGRFDEAGPLLHEAHTSLQVHRGAIDPRTKEASRRLTQPHDLSPSPSSPLRIPCLKISPDGGIDGRTFSLSPGLIPCLQTAVPNVQTMTAGMVWERIHRGRRRAEVNICAETSAH